MQVYFLLGPIFSWILRDILHILLHFWLGCKKFPDPFFFIFVSGRICAILSLSATTKRLPKGG